MKELRAVVLGLVVVVLVASALAFWRRPAPEFARVKGFRVDFREREGDSTRHVTFSVPSNLIARIAKLAPIESFGANLRGDWDHGELSARDILDAAAQSAPGRPGVIRKDDGTIEVTAEGSSLEILVKDDWGKSVRLRIPRAVVESLSGERDITPRELLRQFDELGPGEVITVRDGDKEVTITAEPR
jgi:hypothetical protein